MHHSRPMKNVNRKEEEEDTLFMCQLRISLLSDKELIGDTVFKIEIQKYIQ